MQRERSQRHLHPPQALPREQPVPLVPPSQPRAALSTSEVAEGRNRGLGQFTALVGTRRGRDQRDRDRRDVAAGLRQDRSPRAAPSPIPVAPVPHITGPLGNMLSQGARLDARGPAQGRLAELPRGQQDCMSRQGYRLLHAVTASFVVPGHGSALSGCRLSPSGSGSVLACMLSHGSRVQAPSCLCAASGALLAGCHHTQTL